MTALCSKDFLTEEAIHELSKIKEIEQKIDRDGFIYETGDKKKDKTSNFQKFKTINFFGREFYNGHHTLDFWINKQKFSKSTKPQKKGKIKKTLIVQKVIRLGIRKVLNSFESNIFLIEKPTHGKGHPGFLAHVAKVSDRFHIKILTPKQILLVITISTCTSKSR